MNKLVLGTKARPKMFPVVLLIVRGTFGLSVGLDNS